MKLWLYTFVFCLLSFVCSFDISASEIKLYYDKGRQAISAGDYTEALRMFSLASSLKASPGSEEMEIKARSLNNTGFLLLNHFAKYSEAAEYLFAASKIADTESLPEIKANVMLNLGNLYLTYSKSEKDPLYKDKALDCYMEGYTTAYENGHYPVAIRLFIALAAEATIPKSFGGKENVKLNSIISGFNSKQWPQKLPLFQYAVYRKNAIEALKRDDVPEAVHFTQLQLQSIDTDVDSARYAIDAWSNMTDIYLSESDWGNALKAHRNAYDLVIKHGITDLEVESLDIFARIYALAGDTEKEKAFRIRYYQVQDSLINLTHVKAIKDAAFLADIKEAQSQLIEKDMHYQRTKTVIICLSILLLASVLFSIVVFRQKRALRQSRDILYQQSQNLAKSDPRYLNSTLKEGVKNKLYDKIIEILTTSSAVYSPDFSLATLADLCNSNTKHVSQIINEMSGSNFNHFINGYRIREVCRRMADIENYGNYTVEAFGVEVGFKSRSAFTTVFKEHTGMTPSQYMQHVKKKSK